MNPGNQDNMQPGGTPAPAPAPIGPAPEPAVGFTPPAPEPVSEPVVILPPDPTPAAEPTPAPEPTVDFTPPAPEPIIAAAPIIEEPVVEPVVTVPEPIVETAPIVEEPVAEAPVVPEPTPAPIIEEPAADVPSLADIPADAPAEMAPIGAAPAKKSKTKNLIIILITLVVLVAVGILAWQLIAPNLQGNGDGSGDGTSQTEDPDEEKPTTDPYEELLNTITSENENITRIDLNPTSDAAQIVDDKLDFKVSAATALKGIDGALTESATIIGINLTVTNGNANTVFSLEDLTLDDGTGAYAPIKTIASNSTLLAFTTKYDLTVLYDVVADTTDSGWVFFEIPTAVTSLDLVYTRDDRLNLEAFTSKITIPVKK